MGNCSDSLRSSRLNHGIQPNIDQICAQDFEFGFPHQHSIMDSFLIMQTELPCIFLPSSSQSIRSSRLNHGVSAKYRSNLCSGFCIGFPHRHSIMDSLLIMQTELPCIFLPSSSLTIGSFFCSSPTSGSFVCF